MRYISTRGKQLPISFYEAILQGIASDGGLLVPDFALPQLSLQALADLNYMDLATEVMAPFIPSSDKELLREACRKAYSQDNFPKEVVPVQSVGKVSVAELWHGRTAAFKDMALSLLPHLMLLSKRQLDDNHRVLILTATSGDTGKAALEGFHNVEGTEIIVFYPTDGVSSIQRKQMISQEGKNVHVFGIHGNFDDAQRAVKQALAVLKAQENESVRLSSANSINIGRLLPQVVYYYWSYLEMVRQGKVIMNSPIDVCVPSGNFGNCLAAYLAREMGLPVRRLIVASNKNNILTDFFLTGTYDTRRPFYTTNAPAMDILVSSNLERLLWWISGKNSEAVQTWMNALSTNHVYAIDPATKHRIQSLFRAGYATEQQVLETISQCWQNNHYLLDTHTACAFCVAQQYQQQNAGTPLLLMSTASPYKFPEAVSEALGGDVATLTGEVIPAPLRDIMERKDLHTSVINREDILSTIQQCLDQ